MAKNPSEDPVMHTVREHVESSGMTFQELGEKMGYPPTSARQGVSQFLRGGDPRIGTLRKFARAIGVSLTRLLK